MKSFYYKYLLINNTFWVQAIHFIASAIIHIFLFLVLNLIPNTAPPANQPADWTHVQTAKKRSGKKQDMEIINMVKSASVKYVEDKNPHSAPKKQGKDAKKLAKQKLYDKKSKTKTKIEPLKVKEQASGKLVPEKNAAIAKEKPQSKKVVQLPRIGGERGSRSITDKSPLSAPSAEQAGQLSKKTGSTEGAKDMVAQKTAPKAEPKKEEIKKVIPEKAPGKKELPKPQMKLAEPKKMEMKKLPIPEPKMIEAVKKLEPILEKVKIEEKIAVKAPLPVPVEKLKEQLIKLSEKKVTEEAPKKEILPEKEKIEKIQEAPKAEKMPVQEKIIKDTSNEIAQKSKMSEPVLSPASGMMAKKMIISQTQMIASDKLKNLPPLPPEKSKIEKVDVQDKLKIGSPLGTFDEKIKNESGDMAFAIKGDKELAKALRTTAEIDRSIKDKETNVQVPDQIDAVQSKMMRTLSQNSPLRNRSNIEPIIKTEIKRIEIAGTTPKEEPVKPLAEAQKQELKPDSLKPEEKIGEQEDLKKMIEEIKVQIKQEEEKKDTKAFDTTMEDFFSEKINEEINKDSKIIGTKNIIASGEKGETDKTVAIKRLSDRNPLSVTMRTPLTKVSFGGSTRSAASENITQEDRKKIAEYVQKAIKNEETLGRQETEFRFEPIFKKVDIESLIFPKDKESGSDSGQSDEISKTIENQMDFVVEKESQINEEPQKMSEKSDVFKEKVGFSQIGEPGMGGISGISGISEAGKQKGVFGLKEKQMGEMDRQIKEIAAFVKAKNISMGKHNFPRIIVVTHDATRTLSKGDEVAVILKGDPGEIASFDIGLYRTEIPMNEISPGVYRGTYRVVEGDNIIDAAVVGYLMNKENNQASLVAQTAVTIDTSPGITIATPPRDSTVDKAIQTVTGVIDNPEVKNVVLSLNGNMRNVPVENGYFNSDVELVKGKNIIEVMAVNTKGDIGRDRMEITYASYKTGPKVVISFPSDGDTLNVAESPVIEIQGTVNDVSINKAKLTINNELNMDILVSNGEFKQKVVLFGESNSFHVQVINKEETIGISEPITIKATGIGHYDGIISVTWDAPKADVDLIVKNSTGKFISHKAPNYSQNPNAISGGKLELDDTEGFGPEVITLRQVNADLYSVHASYYEGNGDRVINASVSIILTDPKDPNKIFSKVFGPKTMNVGEEWKVTFIGIPEMKFYPVE
ncbi:hypothetical protein HZA55_10775 [Candidatus Poribacteria bacterium]|nr:hypothetical protein [Candidatus Poribacteria bacterium]